MPLLKKNEAKKFLLPSSKDLAEAEQEWALVEIGPLLGGEVMQTDNFTDRNDFMLNVLTKRIQEWSVKDGDEIAEINTDNVRRLPVEDLTLLIGEMLGSIGGADESDPKEPAAVQIPVNG